MAHMRLTKSGPYLSSPPKINFKRKEVKIPPVNPFPSPHIQEDYLPDWCLMEVVKTCFPQYVNNLGMKEST